MKKPDKANPVPIAKTAAERQREWKAKQRAAGYKLTSIWVHTASYDEGRQACKDGRPFEDSRKSSEPMSWGLGWLSQTTD
mgnify:CR=1 FL=1